MGAFWSKSHHRYDTVELTDMGESLNLLDENHQRDETISMLNSKLHEMEYKLSGVEELFNSSKKSHANEIYHLNNYRAILRETYYKHFQLSLHLHTLCELHHWGHWFQP